MPLHVLICISVTKIQTWNFLLFSLFSFFCVSFTMKPKVSKKLSWTWTTLLCISCFFLGAIFTSRFWLFLLSFWVCLLAFQSLNRICIFRLRPSSSDSGNQLILQHRRDQKVNIVSEDYGHEKVFFLKLKNFIGIFQFQMYISSIKISHFIIFEQNKSHEKDVMEEVLKTHKAIEWVKLL